jgi:hypothetical protein
MSICLISIAESNSFVHRAADLLAGEFETIRHQVDISQTQLQQALKQIRPDNLQSVNAFKALLTGAGFDISSVLEHQSCVVLSRDIVPIDLISVNGEDIGRQISISHLISDNFLGLITQGYKGLTEKQLTLERIVFLPVTNLTLGFSRIEQDLIKSALGLTSKVSVDLLINPSVPLALNQFNRQDAQILHVDSHAASTAIQLAPRAKLSTLADFQFPITVPLILLIACSTAKNRDSLGQKLLEHGALATIGAFFDWLTGSFTDDITSPDVYDAFYGSLLSGETVGNAFVAAKQKMVGNLSNAGQLLLGNQFLKLTPI